jgi:hypothetical protein
MLSPNKHTSIKYSILYIAGLIVSELKRSGIIKYDELKDVVINSTGKELGENFEYSLSYLFLLDKISYNQHSDTFNILQP